MNYPQISAPFVDAKGVLTKGWPQWIDAVTKAAQTATDATGAHNDLTLRDASDCHPATAISFGLETVDSALSGLQSSLSALGISVGTIGETAATALETANNALSLGNANSTAISNTNFVVAGNEARITSLESITTTYRDHNLLDNVQQAASGVLNGHISASSQTIYGSKTFIDNTIFGAALVGTATDQPDYAVFTNKTKGATTQGGLVVYPDGRTALSSDTILDLVNLGGVVNFSSAYDSAHAIQVYGGTKFWYSGGVLNFNTSIMTTGFIKSGGIASQFLKADGSVDGSSYLSSITGDVTTSGSVATISASVVTFAKMQNSAAAGISVVGRSAQSAGVFAEITAGTDGFVLRRSGTALGFGTLAPGAFAANTAAHTTLANSAVGGFLGHSGTTSSALSMISSSTQYHVPVIGAASALAFGFLTTASFGTNAVGATNGGTGQTVYAVGDVLYASTTTALSKFSPGSTAGNFRWNGTAWVIDTSLYLTYAILSNVIDTANVNSVKNGDLLCSNTGTTSVIRAGSAGGGAYFCSFESDPAYSDIWAVCNLYTVRCKTTVSEASVTVSDSTNRAVVSPTGFSLSGGTASQFLKANGTVDTNTYALASALTSYIPLTGSTAVTGAIESTSYSKWGNAKIGNWAVTASWARFGHSSWDGSTYSGFLQYSDGNTLTNSKLARFACTEGYAFESATSAATALQFGASNGAKLFSSYGTGYSGLTVASQGTDKPFITFAKSNGSTAVGDIGYKDSGNFGIYSYSGFDLETVGLFRLVSATSATTALQIGGYGKFWGLAGGTKADLPLLYDPPTATSGTISATGKAVIAINGNATITGGTTGQTLIVYATNGSYNLAYTYASGSSLSPLLTTSVGITLYCIDGANSYWRSI